MHYFTNKHNFSLSDIFHFFIVHMLAIAGQTDGSDWLTFVEGTGHMYPSKFFKI